MEGVPDMNLLERKRAIMSAFFLAMVLSVGLVKNKEITNTAWKSGSVKPLMMDATGTTFLWVLETVQVLYMLLILA